MNKKETKEKESVELNVQRRASRINFLQSLLERPIGSDEGLFSIFLASCGSSHKLWRDMSYGKRINWKREAEKDRRYRSRMELKMLKNKYYNFIHVLRKDGILSLSDTVTEKGKRWLKDALVKRGNAFPAPSSYEKINTPNVILVTYDIPRRLNRLRWWIVRVLRALNFEMLHESAWIGNRVLPKKFIDDLERLGLLNYVHIVMISKTATLRIS